MKRRRQRLDHQRLGQPRHANDQSVRAGQGANQKLIDNGVLPNDDIAQTFADSPDTAGKGIKLFLGQLDRFNGSGHGSPLS